MTRRLSHWSVLLCIGALACASTQAGSSPAVADPAAAAPTSPEAAGEPEVASSATDAAVGAATSAAQSWLALVDNGQYDESWKGAAAVFRGAVSSEAWATAVGGVRGPLGKLSSRQVAAAEFKTSLPSAPDGKYVVIQFSTVFENKGSAVETVTPTQEPDGSWRVAGYYVR